MKFYLFFKKDFIYLFMRDTERGRDTGRGRNRLLAGTLLWNSIPGAWDHALSPGSCPEPKADAQPLSHPGIPRMSILLSFFFLKRFYLFIHERHRGRGRDIGRGRSRLLAGSLICRTRSQDPREFKFN